MSSQQSIPDQSDEFSEFRLSEDAFIRGLNEGAMSRFTYLGISQYPIPNLRMQLPHIYMFIDVNNNLWVHRRLCGFFWTRGVSQYVRVSTKIVPKMKFAIQNMFGITFVDLEGKLGLWDPTWREVRYFECPTIISMTQSAILDIDGNAYDVDYDKMKLNKIESGVKELLHIYGYQPTFLLEDGTIKCDQEIANVGKIKDCRNCMILCENGDVRYFSCTSGKKSKVIYSDPNIIGVASYIPDEIKSCIFLYEDGAKLYRRKSKELIDLDTNGVKVKQFINSINAGLNTLMDEDGDLYEYKVAKVLRLDQKVQGSKFELLTEYIKLPAELLK